MKKKSVSKKRKEKRIRKEKPEESEIEEEIENAEKEINLEELTKTENGAEENIKNFLISEKVKAPVLERIANQETIPSFVQIGTERETPERKIDYAISNEPKYSAGTTFLQEEKKYETTFIPPSLTQRETPEREFFMPMKNAWEETKQISETPEQFGMFESKRKKLPFEEEQKKYKRTKF